MGWIPSPSRHAYFIDKPTPEYTYYVNKSWNKIYMYLSRNNFGTIAKICKPIFFNTSFLLVDLPRHFGSADTVRISSFYFTPVENKIHVSLEASEGPERFTTQLRKFDRRNTTSTRFPLIQSIHTKVRDQIFISNYLSKRYTDCLFAFGKNISESMARF